MKFSFPALTLLVAILFASAACDSQKAASTASASPANKVEKGDESDPVASLTIAELDAAYEGLEKAYLAGGCFWCTEASLDRIKGVADVFSGYAGGEEPNPTYRQVASGQTGHAEAIVVYYDPEVITYEKILDVFFVAHDPTTLNRQGPDRGPQYRSTVFPVDDEQERIARAKIDELNASKFNGQIVTTIEKAEPFYLAEAYHQDYYEDPNNPNQGYVNNVSKPKVDKVMKVFKDRVKEEFLK